MSATGPIRVLVVDDSASVRQAMSEILGADPAISVIGSARDPFLAAEMIRREVPDVITLDVEMPRMDGITFLRKLMAQRPIPVVVCSSLVGEGTETLLQALEAGAVDIVQKPHLGVTRFLGDQAERIREVVRAAAGARLVRQSTTTTRQNRPDPAAVAGAMARTTQPVVAIGASTGGTEALRWIIERLPPFAPPIAIVQHMPEAFTRAFAERLDKLARIEVREARDGDSLLRGQALIAPGNRHLEVGRSGASYHVTLEDGPPVNRHRPSADVLFRSVARTAGRNGIGVILTGMGKDGAAGLLEMREAGAVTLGQDEASCVVYGMPRAAREAGAVVHEVTLADMPEMIEALGRERV